MAFLKNAWYAAAWSNEVGRALLARTILGESVLMYRTHKGEPTVVSNRCPHRFAPLDRGRLVEDEVECAYHGLRYDSRGVCVHNPQGDGTIPKTARLRCYPAVEKYRVLWVWTGDPEKADIGKIPDFGFMQDSEHYGITTGTIPIKANYELMSDNLLDLTHTQFLHGDIFKSDAVMGGLFEVIEQGTTIHSNGWCPGAPPTPPLRLALNYDKTVDFWMNMRWDPPALMRFDVGATPTGKRREEGVHNLEMHVLTPETENSTHYFWGDARTYGINDPVVEENNRRALEHAFVEQDKPMLEAQQAMMGTPDLLSLGPAMLKGDAAAIRARRVLARLIAEERI